MAENDLTKTSTELVVPDFMEKDEAMGTETLMQFLRPPYLKLISSSSKDTKKEFGEGHVIIMPEKRLVAQPGESFNFVPLFVYLEFCAMNPWQLKDSLPMVRERTRDPKDPLAKKCKNPKQWREDCPECPPDKDYKIRNVEIINFVVALIDPGFEGVFATMSFSGGEHKTGRQLATMIQGRNAPIFGCAFKASMSLHEYAGDNEDWGYDIENADPAFVEDAEIYEKFKESHLLLAKNSKDDKLEAQYDGEEAAAEDAEETEETPF